MSSRFVSLAIDHGTTNSCIARMTPQGPRVIPAEGGIILPSAVYYDSKGGLRVGTAAREAILTTSAKDGQGFTGYKLHIGGDMRYEFKAARKSLTSPEMGAVIIQTLLRAHFRESGEDATSCVITIPAKFKQNSVEGTKAAAAMAGLKYHPLIMEPVAAAMCYGFRTDEQRAEWMIFDLGGGTLDVSLVISRKGKLVVPEGGHAGDDNLGGSKFDRELAGYVLDRLEKQYKLTAFRNQRAQFATEWGRLLLAVEAAKIKLSTQQEALVELEGPLCRDDNKKDVEVKISVPRAAYEELIRPDAERAVAICQTLLKTNQLKASEVERLILVGGPSHTPIIRKLLAERLGIRLESSVDPMTAVAEGAAIYAEQVEIPESLRVSSKPAANGYSVRMECEHQSPVPVYGAIGLVDGPSKAGLRVEVERLDGGWKSQQLRVDESGVFSVELMLIEGKKPVMSQFRTTLLDASGREVARVDEPQIWYPSLALENRLANSIRVAVKNNRTSLLIAPGAELPANGEGDFGTTKALRRGSKDDVLKIGVLESAASGGKEDDQASSCLHVGTLLIVGSDSRVTMDVPVGSEIQVRLKVDESRNITAVAYIPLLDAEFETVFKGEKFEYELKDLPGRVEQIKLALAEIEKLQGKRPNKDVGEALESLRRQKLLESVATDLERAKTGDKDCEVRVYKRILEIEGTIRSLHRMQNRSRVEVAVEGLSATAQGPQSVMLADIKREFAACGSEEELERVVESVERLEFAVRGQPWNELRLDVLSLMGIRVTQRQGDVYKKADALWDRIEAKGGIGTATDADISEMKKMHTELEDAYPDLYDHRQRKLDELGRGGGGPVDLSDLEKRG